MTETPNSAALPPKPDPQTGEPFPPHGRAWRGRDTAPEADPNWEARLSHKPEPPRGKGPVLAWHKESKRGKIAGFLWGAAIIIGGGSILAVIDGDPPFAWIQYWQLWIVVLVSGFLMSKPLTYTTMSAGADWFQCQIVRFGMTVRKKHLDLYRLRRLREQRAQQHYIWNLLTTLIQSIWQGCTGSLTARYGI